MSAADDKPKKPERLDRANAELGREFARLLGEKNSHAFGVCARLGIPWRTHTRWMSRDASDLPHLAAYQREVLVGLDNARKADLDAIDTAIAESAGSHVATVWNARKHRHESRFRRFYSEPKRVELSGPGGGPVRIDSRLERMSDAQLQAIIDGADPGPVDDGAESGGEDEVYDD